MCMCVSACECMRVIASVYVFRRDIYICIYIYLFAFIYSKNYNTDQVCFVVVAVVRYQDNYFVMRFVILLFVVVVI